MCGNGTDYNLIALGLKSIYQMERQLAKSIHQWENYLEDKGENALAEEVANISNTLWEAGLNLDKIIKYLEASADDGHHHSHHHHSHDHDHSHGHVHHHHNHDQEHGHHHSQEKKEIDNTSNIDVTILSGEDKK